MVRSPTLQHANDNMHRAFSAVCTTLQLTKAGEPATELVATRVLEIAGGGVADAEEIATRALVLPGPRGGSLGGLLGRAVTPREPAPIAESKARDSRNLRRPEPNKPINPRSSQPGGGTIRPDVS